MNKDLQQLSKEIDKKFVKQSKELRQELHRDYQNQGKFLLEEFNKNLRIVAEVQTDHTKQLKSIIEMVGQNTESIDVMKNMLKRKVDVEEFEFLERRVGIIEKKLRFNS